MKQRFFILLFAIVASIGTMCANTVNGTCGENLTWSYDTETHALVISGTGEMYDYYVNTRPSEKSDNRPWSTVASSITSISIAEGVTSIGSYAFSACSSLASIVLPNGVTHIGERAFGQCYGLENVTIPSSVNQIDYVAFEYCENLNAVYITDMKAWCAINFNDYGSNPLHHAQNLYLNGQLVTNLVIPEGVTAVNANAFYNCSITNVSFASTVQSIGFFAFGSCHNLTSVTIPNSVTNIELYAFNNCSSLTSITLSTNLQSIGDETFDGCPITEITIPAAVTSIGTSNFNNCTDIYFESATPFDITSNTFNSAATIHVPCNSVSNYMSAPIWQFLNIVGSMDYKFQLSAEQGGTAKIINGVCSANTVVIEATATEDGYYFTGWSDGSTDNPRTILLTEDKSVTALFGRNLYQVNIYDINYGYVYADGNETYFNDSWSGELPAGSSITVYPQDRECGYFTNWSNGETEWTLYLTISQDTTVYAVYTGGGSTFNVSITAGENGYLSEESTGTITTCNDYYEVCTEAYANEGYRFARWSDGSTEQYRCIYITSDTTITAIFEDMYSGTCGDNLTWVFNPETGALVISGTGDMYAYWYESIPWNDYRESINSVSLPNGITSISSEAFYGCSNLTSLILPNSVTSVGYGFLYNSGVTLPVYNSHIFAYMPQSYSGTYAIPSGIEMIADGAFNHCENITFVTIPNTVTTIGEEAFYGCSSLTAITIPNSVKTIGIGAFVDCYGLTEMIIPEGVEEIGNYAFEECESLRKLVIPASVTEMGYRLIESCYNISYLSVPANFFTLIIDNDDDFEEIKIDEFPHYTHVLDTVIFTSGYMEEIDIEMLKYSYKTLSYLDLAGISNTTLPDKIFSDCYNLRDVILPNGLERVGYMALADCIWLQEVTIPASVTEIEARAFENCRSLSSINIADNSQLTTIGNWAFFMCLNLKNLTIPEGVTEIGDAAFYACNNLVDIKLPASVQRIGSNGFAECTKMQQIKVSAIVPPEVDNLTFFNVDQSSVTAIVPEESVEAYTSHPVWSRFFIKGVPTGVSTISTEKSALQKQIINGVLYITTPDNRTYNMHGTEVK